MNDVILGGGEVGITLYELLGKTIGLHDIDSDKIKNYDAIKLYDVGVIHICFPYSKKFKASVLGYVEIFNPKLIVIHSTIPVGTSHTIQIGVGSIPVIYTPTRGVHSRFVKDMKRYTKLWASAGVISNGVISLFLKIWTNTGVVTDRWESVKDLELAKTLIDTTYYGWLIAFRFAADAIATNYGANKNKIWEFADEIHEILGNRPKMFSNPEGIGGHCVLPNLELNSDKTADYIKNVINIINSNHRKLNHND